MGRLALIAGLLIALAIPVTADASTQWSYTAEAGGKRKPIAEGTRVSVPTTSSKFTVVLKEPKASPVKFPCAVHGSNEFWNTPEGGRDRTSSISFACAGATVTPFLPWTSTLAESEYPLFDQWTVSLDLEVGGIDKGTFSGVLEAKVGDVDPEGEKGEVGKDELDNNIYFKGGRSTKLPHLHLTALNGNELWFSGYQRQGGNATGVGDE